MAAGLSWFVCINRPLTRAVDAVSVGAARQLKVVTVITLLGGGTLPSCLLIV